MTSWQKYMIPIGTGSNKVRSGNAFLNDNSFSRWIIDKSFGLSKWGVERLGESVRVYVWLVMTSQVRAGGSIVTVDGKGLTAQRLFLENLRKVAVNGEWGDVAGSVDRYKKVLGWARSKVNYVVGEGVYMLPSDMDLHVGDYVQYNQDNFVSKPSMNIGKNKDQNTNLYKPNKSTILINPHKANKSNKFKKIYIYRS